jgi:GNAT superfamily N-acetyltransferase
MIHKAHRRKGYGTHVLKHALTIAWLHNCYTVLLLTGRQDEGVFHFYEGAGFKRGLKMEFIAVQNND